MDYRLRRTPLEKERVRQLARIGANLNQVARWANTYKSQAEALQVLAALFSLERELRRYAGPMGSDPRETPPTLESKPSVVTSCT